MDWDICILCQTSTSIPLIDASNSKNTAVCGYSKLVENIRAFQSKHIEFPTHLLSHISELDAGDGMLDTIKRNNGKWHKNCALELSSSR